MLEVVRKGNKEYATDIPYSTSERRIGTWIDGKPLYRKVIDFGTLPNATSKRVNHGISNGNLVKIDNIYIKSNGNLGGKIPNGDPSDFIRFWFTDTYIEVLTTSDRSDYTTCYFIIEYTKTTD